MMNIMKNIFKLGLISILALSLSSCEKWLDINVNPNSPTNLVASVDARLPWIQHHYQYAYGSASVRAGFITGALTANSTTTANGLLAAWNPAQSSSTTPYQQWFVGAACNLKDLIEAAEKEEAWHYIGAAYTLKAMGFMLMLDWYGEMPYTEALGSTLTPKFDNGQTIFEGCMKDLDEALKYFEKAQPTTATPLSKGDSWNGGNVQKWVKMIYGLKARWLNNLSKKSTYSPTAILDAVSKGPSSNAESTVINHVNDLSDMTGDVLIGDPLKTAYLFNVTAWSDGNRFTKFYTDLLDNTFTGGSGVVDPRAAKILPYRQSHYVWDPATSSFKKGFVRTQGVDVHTSNIRLNGGPMLMSFNTTTKKYFVNTTNPLRLGDTVYVGVRALCAMTGALTTESLWKATDGTILSTGSFYTRPESPTFVMTYHEMCFIKAEVLFRQGDLPNALIAYKAGIRANMELINSKLAQYSSAENPAKAPMTTTEIDNFLASAAVAQTTSQLTMAKIMQQKFIAMSLTQQNWNDMRRFNYSAGNIGNFGVVYPGFDRPFEFGATAATKMTGTTKSQDNYWFRRMMSITHEMNYNSAQLKASNPKAMDVDIWSVPVWWDMQ
ncbi:hypothetical protein MASR2M69_14530 [Bacteroidota bacterium]